MQTAGNDLHVLLRQYETKEKEYNYSSCGKGKWLIPNDGRGNRELYRLLVIYWRECDDKPFIFLCEDPNHDPQFKGRKNHRFRIDLDGLKEDKPLEFALHIQEWLRSKFPDANLECVIKRSPPKNKKGNIYHSAHIIFSNLYLPLKIQEAIVEQLGRAFPEITNEDGEMDLAMYKEKGNALRMAFCDKWNAKNKCGERRVCLPFGRISNDGEGDQLDLDDECVEDLVDFMGDASILVFPKNDECSVSEDQLRPFLPINNILASFKRKHDEPTPVELGAYTRMVNTLTKMMAKSLWFSPEVQSSLAVTAAVKTLPRTSRRTLLPSTSA
jgi:hypothetical protein